jgi:hypothetical protein
MIVIVSYDPAWPDRFNDEAERIRGGGGCLPARAFLAAHPALGCHCRNRIP